MARPEIPAELRRAVLVEAGHRCAIPRCGSTQIDIHHITPWEQSNRHEYENLIALCPNCHRRAHNGEIDRKSLRLYKAQLVSDFPKSDPDEFAAPIVEIKRCLSEQGQEIPEFAPGYDFSFEFPDFCDPAARIVSRNIEAWGNELLLEYRERQKTKDPRVDFAGMPYWLRGAYEVVRKDSRVISVRYTLIEMAPGAAHRATHIRVQNFSVQPFKPLILDEMLSSPESVSELAELCQNELLSQAHIHLDREDVMSGAAARPENFQLFEIGPYAIRFIFPEYQVGPYAVGPQFAVIPFERLREVFDDEILDSISRAEDF